MHIINYTFYIREEGGEIYLTAWRHRNSPVSSQIKALAREKLRLIQQKSNLLFVRANEIWNAFFCHFVFIILPIQSSAANHLVGMPKKQKHFLLSSRSNHSTLLTFGLTVDCLLITAVIASSSALNQAHHAAAHTLSSDPK